MLKKKTKINIFLNLFLIQLTLQTDLIIKKEDKKKLLISYSLFQSDFQPISKISEDFVLSKDSNFINFSTENNYIKFEMRENLKYKIRFNGECDVPLFFNYDSEKEEDLKILENQKIELNYINLGALFLETLNLKKEYIFENIENSDFYPQSLKNQQIYVYNENRTGVIFCLNFKKKKNLNFFLEWDILETKFNSENKIRTEYLGNSITYTLNEEIKDAFLTKKIFLSKNFTKIIKIINLRKITNIYLKELKSQNLEIEISFPQNPEKTPEKYKQINFTDEFENIREISIKILNSNEKFSDLQFEFFTRDNKILKDEKNVEKSVLIVFSIIIVILFIVGLILLFYCQKKKKNIRQNSGVYEQRNTEVNKIGENLEILNDSVNSRDFREKKEKNLVSERVDMSYTSEDQYSSKSDDLLGKKGKY